MRQWLVYFLMLLALIWFVIGSQLVLAGYLQDALGSCLSNCGIVAAAAGIAGAFNAAVGALLGGAAGGCAAGCYIGYVAHGGTF